MGRIDATRLESKGPAAALFEKSLVWDNHTCTTLTPKRAEWMAQLQRYRSTGVDMVCLNVGFDAAAPQNALLLLAEFRHWLRNHPDHFALVERAADIEQARQGGKLGVCFNLEGGNALFENVDMVS